MDGRVAGAEKRDGTFLLTTTFGTIRAQRMVLATGIVDKAPAIEELEEAVAAGTVRLCPVCDAYEAVGKRIGVVGPVHLALKEALFLKEYSGQVTLLASYPEDISEDARGMASAGVIESGTPSRIWSRGQPGSTLSWPTVRQCGTWMWCTPQWALMCTLKLAVALGAGCDAQGYVLVSRHLETSTAGLYAIGDVAEGLNQIAVAFGHAATAARHIDNALQSRPGS